MQNRQTREMRETGRRHVIVIADTNHVGVGVISVENWILVRAVATVGRQTVD